MRNQPSEHRLELRRRAKTVKRMQNSSRDQRGSPVNAERRGESSSSPAESGSREASLELNARDWTPGVEPCAETKSSRHCHLGRDSRFLYPLASLHDASLRPRPSGPFPGVPEPQMSSRTSPKHRFSKLVHATNGCFTADRAKKPISPSICQDPFIFPYETNRANEKDLSRDTAGRLCPLLSSLTRCFPP